jgi:hypothetical protein
MNNGIKMALIFAVGVMAAVGLYLYFSPYQTCVRALTSQAGALPGTMQASDDPTDRAEILHSAQYRCTRNSN